MIYFAFGVLGIVGGITTLGFIGLVLTLNFGTYGYPHKCEYHGWQGQSICWECEYKTEK